jgi:sensor domain CHASE-containing protein
MVCQNRKVDVVGSIIVDDSQTFSLKKHYEHGEHVLAGTVIAQQGEKDIIVDRDVTIIMPSAYMYSGEEYCFL